MLVIRDGRLVLAYPGRGTSGYNVATEEEAVWPQMETLDLEMRVKKRTGIAAYKVTVVDPGHSVRVKSRRGEALRISWRDFAYHWMPYPQARYTGESHGC